MMRKGLAGAIGLVVLSTLVIAPAHAGVKCKKFKPRAPQTESNQGAEAEDAEVNKVTKKATEDNPVEVTFMHGPGLWATSDTPPLLEDAVFTNYQVISTADPTLVSVRLDWTSRPSPSDIDLYIYDDRGSLIYQSVAFNLQGGGDDGTGYEQMLGMAMEPCSGFTVESRVSSGGLDTVIAKVWQG